MTDSLVSTKELLVLYAVLSRGNKASQREIHEGIFCASELWPATLAAVTKQVYHLADRGYILRSRVAGAAPRNGEAIMVYSVTADGIGALIELDSVYVRLRELAKSAKNAAKK